MDIRHSTTDTCSSTPPVCTPPITATSLVPLMVTVTSWLALPSLETAVKESVIDWPAPSCWIARWEEPTPELQSRLHPGGKVPHQKAELGWAVKLACP